ncbi:MAG: VWA domain-containing protein [Bacteroidota bacterium]
MLKKIPLLFLLAVCAVPLLGSSLQEFSFKIVDAGTLFPIRDARVELIQGKTVTKCSADLIGNPSANVPFGAYRVMVTAPGYVPLDTLTVLNDDKPIRVFMLHKQVQADDHVKFSVNESGSVISLNIEDLHEPEPEEEPEEIKDTVVPVQATVIGKTTVVTPVVIPKTPVVEPDPKPEGNTVMRDKLVESFIDPAFNVWETDTAAAAELPATLEESLTEAEYVPNNIVFLVDRSASMALDGRFELLKKSILKLMVFLRPVDKISVVAYGSGVEVLFAGVEGSDVTAVKEGLKLLKPAGTSDIVSGLRKAYEIAQEEFIAGGSNLIILATDGDIAINGPSKVLIGKNLASGTRLSVFGIRNAPFTELSMRELAKLGAGDYLNMRKGRKVEQMLIDEIKDKSLIRK